VRRAAQPAAARGTRIIASTMCVLLSRDATRNAIAVPQ
jgi:hypothetical protein